MHRHRKSPPPIARDPAYRQAFERLDAALEKNTPWDNSEKIRLMRLAYFADVDELERSGEVAAAMMEADMPTKAANQS